ncbi:death-associated inhibitor of apoptosis 1 [Teleopsis dalmanni]|uniref:death-associated inhibitor of apoptosis 1 n=1 Tax=Teleopsis dalmanni TaxID=139649 RepID=UPI0018CE559A|nr:death-associated inhibitor of apoptosis 1 [Teleopsis dalmanni]XP_037931022.1 death-associated inhibitor of apoptosis 1 [Teleopsis dalmanni]XP_037931028.1 death-associated inhibitor of apoptosis 1 [Teleopsis dalmanni]XP_037931033.1 death-associated inhibitor of apoptosis 1 [Teleopsis dalmanni]
MSGATVTIPLGTGVNPLYQRRNNLNVIDEYRRISVDVVDNKTNELYIIPHKMPIYTISDIFSREEERLKTFDSWPLEWLNKNQLAQTGMFFTGDCDKVKCYFCEVEIGCWERDDEPVSEHLRWSPNCPLLRRRTTNNEPIDAEALSRLLPPVSYDICGANDTTEVRSGLNSDIRNSEPDVLTANINVNVGSCRSGTNNSFVYPEYPEYAIETARVRSFAEWPRNMKQKPEELSRAGFFYTGVGDRVKCYSCGGGLKDWEDNDDPWEQHALWLSKCRFLKLIKGQSYIDNIIAKYKSKETDEIVNGEVQKPESVPEPYMSPVLLGTLTPARAMMVGGGSNNIYCDSITSGTSVQAVANTTPELTAATVSLDVAPTFATADKKINATIPEEKLCKICYAEEYNTAFLPCGHVVACAKCASSVQKCPMCRKPFMEVTRVYFS